MNIHPLLVIELSKLNRKEKTKAKEKKDSYFSPFVDQQFVCFLDEQINKRFFARIFGIYVKSNNTV